MNIRFITEGDFEQVMIMMQDFYSSPAVYTNGSDNIFKNDIQSCINGSPYIEGYIFEEDGEIQGYSMVAKSFSTEFGRPCIWLEDIYIKEKYRGSGIGSEFIAFISEKYKGHVIRLEAEAENEGAVRVYKKSGFDFLPYLEMIKLN